MDRSKLSTEITMWAIAVSNHKATCLHADFDRTAILEDERLSGCNHVFCHSGIKEHAHRHVSFEAAASENHPLCCPDL